MTLSGHVGVKVGGGQVLGLGLARAPFHKEAIAQTTEEAQHEHGFGISDAATVVIVGHVEPLVQAVFYAAKAGAVEAQPGWGVQALRRGVGQQGDGLGFATGGEAADSGHLCGGREADRLGGGRGRAEDAEFIAAAVALLGAGARARRFLRGERLPELPAAALLSSRAYRADCL